MIFDLPSFESFCVTVAVTVARTIIEASPTILGGVAIAAWLRTGATPEKIESIFTGNGLQGSLRTVFVGMALPVCAIGILPVLRELRKLGLPTHKLITLGIAAPLLNPFSLLFGLTVLSSLQYLMMIATVFILAIVFGEISSRFAVASPVNVEPRPAGLTGSTRIKNLLIASSRFVTGRAFFDLVLTVIIATAALTFIRYGAMMYLCESGNPAGPAMASLLTLPQYVSPSRAVIQFAGIADANLSIATGLGIYVCGTGIAGAGVLAFCQWFGWRRMMALAISMFLVVGILTYLVAYALPAPVGEIAETGVLDNLNRPAEATFMKMDRAFEESLAFIDTFMMAGTGALAILILAGLYVRFAKVELLDDDPEEAARENAARMSKAMSASQLGSVAIGMVAVLFCLAAYIFFPNPSELLGYMERDEVDTRIAVRTGNRAAALDLIGTWDSSAARIPIGATLRGSFPSKPQRELVRNLRMELRATRELLDQGDFETAKTKLAGLKQLLTETKIAFLGSEE